MKRYAREESMFVVFIAAVVLFVAVFPNGAKPSQRPLNEGTDIGGRAIVMSFVEGPSSNVFWLCCRPQRCGNWLFIR